jgi:Cu2+-exporting ATPase
MQKYDITGMSCAACSARVEKAVNGLEGIQSCSVNLLTNSMMIEGDVDSAAVIDAVKKAGYGASVAKKARVPGAAQGTGSAGTKQASSSGDSNPFDFTIILRHRLIPSVILLLCLMYFSMGSMMFGFPIPAFLHNHLAFGGLQAVLALVIMIINRKFFISGTKAVFSLAPNMDTLVALGSAASFIYSLCVLLFTNQHDFYFESAAMIVTLVTIGKMLEEKAKGKTTASLKELMKLAPETVTVLRGSADGDAQTVAGTEITIPIEELKEDDIFIVRPGQNIPADGLVVEGAAFVNEAAITGESELVSKQKDDEVTSATTNVNGVLKCKALKVGENTTLAQIISLVSDSAASKAPVQRVADKVAGIFVPVVLGIAVVTFVVWMLFGKEVGYSLQRAISVLVISCPCALGLATPVAIMVGNGTAAKKGILFKNSVALEQTGKAKVVILDKTGTITKGEPVVTGVSSVMMSEAEIIRLAYLLEKNSTHPVAKAIIAKANELGVAAENEVINNTPVTVTGFEEIPGKGVKGIIDGSEIFCGAVSGKNGIVVTKDGMAVGIISTADEIKPDSATAVEELKKAGVKVVMLTGDNQLVAQKVGKAVGVDDVIAGVTPVQKEAAVRDYKKDGYVIMVGDGINDAPALVSADIGIAIGAGSDIAIDSASVVLVKNSLMDVVNAVKISRKVMKNIYENLGWAFCYNIIGIPLAAGCFIKLFGWSLSPMFGAAAMSISSFCVVMNALRLRRIKTEDR